MSARMKPEVEAAAAAFVDAEIAAFQAECRFRHDETVRGELMATLHHAARVALFRAAVELRGEKT